MNTIHLTDDNVRIVQAYQALDSLKSDGGTIGIDINGVRHDITASPEVVRSLKTAFGSAILNPTTGGASTDMTFSKQDVASTLKVDSTQLDGLVSKSGASDDSYTTEDVMPWLAERVSEVRSEPRSI